MCEILIKAKDNVNPDPELDKLNYKRGHFVAVMPDGHTWGKKECLPDFFILKIPGVSVDQFDEYMKPELDTGDAKKQIITKRRIHKLDIDATTIPKAIRNAVKNTGVATITKAQIINHLRR